MSNAGLMPSCNFPNRMSIPVKVIPNFSLYISIDCLNTMLQSAQSHKIHIAFILEMEFLQLSWQHGYIIFTAKHVLRHLYTEMSNIERLDTFRSQVSVKYRCSTQQWCYYTLQDFMQIFSWELGFMFVNKNILFIVNNVLPKIVSFMTLQY